MAIGCGSSPSPSSSRWEQSMTSSRAFTPICGAANPMPGARYMVSNMSCASLRRSSSISETGSQTFFRRGSGWMRMGRIMARSYVRAGVKSTGCERRLPLDRVPDGECPHDIAKTRQQAEPVPPHNRVLGIHRDLVEEGIDGRAEAGHLGHCGGEILLSQRRADGGLRRVERLEKSMFLGKFRKLLRRRAGIFDVILLL